MYNSRKDIRLFVLVLLLCHIITCHCKPLKVGYQIEEVSIIFNKYIGSFISGICSNVQMFVFLKILAKKFENCPIIKKKKSMGMIYVQVTHCKNRMGWNIALYLNAYILIIPTQQKIIPTYLHISFRKLKMVPKDSARYIFGLSHPWFTILSCDQ